MGAGQARSVAGRDYVVLMADMFGTGYGAIPKSQDDLRAGMLAVHKDLRFTIACGAAAYDTLFAEANKLGLVDEVLKEPHGGAHRDPQGMAETLKQSLIKNLAELSNQPVTQLLDARQARLRGFGVFRVA